MKDRRFGEGTAIDKIRWESFPQSAQRLIRGSFDDIDLENTENPDRGNILKKEIAVFIHNISTDRLRYTNASLGTTIIEAAKARRNFNTGKLDEVGRQLEILGQSITALRVTPDSSRSS